MTDIYYNNMLLFDFELFSNHFRRTVSARQAFSKKIKFEAQINICRRESIVD